MNVKQATAQRDLNIALTALIHQGQVRSSRTSNVALTVIALGHALLLSALMVFFFVLTFGNGLALGIDITAIASGVSMMVLGHIASNHRSKR